LVLGLLPDELAGGSIELRRDLAEAGVDRLARQVGLNGKRMAEGILELSAHNQANAVTQLTVKRGIDPSDDALVAFGGAGPLQALRIAEILGLTTVLVPPSPGNVSAFGLLAVDLKDDYVATLVRRHDEVDPEEASGTFAGLEEEAAASLRAQGVPEDRVRLLRGVDARYLGEAHEIAIAAGDPFDPERAAEAFHEAHERIYGYAYRHAEVVEFVNWKVTGVGLIERPTLRAPAPAARVRGAQPRPERGRYRRDDLPAGFRGKGPAVIDEYGSTTVVNGSF